MNGCHCAYSGGHPGGCQRNVDDRYEFGSNKPISQLERTNAKLYISFILKLQYDLQEKIPLQAHQLPVTEGYFPLPPATGLQVVEDVLAVENGAIVEFVFDPQQLVIFADAVGPAQRAGLDLPGVDVFSPPAGGLTDAFTEKFIA